MTQNILITITAMTIAREYENNPFWVADWPHCSDFGGNCGGFKSSKLQVNAPFHLILLSVSVLVGSYFEECQFEIIKNSQQKVNVGGI